MNSWSVVDELISSVKMTCPSSAFLAYASPLVSLRLTFKTTGKMTRSKHQKASKQLEKITLTDIPSMIHCFLTLCFTSFRNFCVFCSNKDVMRCFATRPYSSLLPLWRPHQECGYAFNDRKEHTTWQFHERSAFWKLHLCEETNASQLLHSWDSMTFLTPITPNSNFKIQRFYKQKRLRISWYDKTACGFNIFHTVHTSRPFCLSFCKNKQSDKQFIKNL